MTRRVGVYSPETAKMVLEVVRYLKQSGYVIERPGRGGQLASPPTPIYVRNDSGEAIPPFACMQTRGAVDAGGQNYLSVTQPADTTGEAGSYLFNGPAEIEEDGYGVAHDGPVVRMLTDGSSLAAGDPVSPETGSWAVTSGCGPFVAIGADDIGTNIIRAFAWQPEKHKAKWIKFRFTPDSEENVSVDSFWDGVDPAECGDVEVEYPLGEPCVEADVIAFHDPNTDTYQAIATEAAMLGEPETMDTVQAMAFDGCGINYMKQSIKAFPCGSEPSLINTSPTMQEVLAVTGVQETASALAFSFTSIMVCTAQPSSGKVFIPIDDCEPPEPPACGDYCRYEWLPDEGEETFSWQQTGFCDGDCECVTESGDFPAPGEGDPLIKEFPCVEPEEEP